MMRLRFCRHLEQPRCQQFPWADDGSLSLISARWLTLMDAGHESRPALISARSFTKTPEVEFRGRLSTGLSLKMKMSPRIHSGTSGSCKNEAARKTWPPSSCSFARRIKGVKSQWLTVGVHQRCRKAMRSANVSWRAGCRASWHMFPPLPGLCRKVMRARILESSSLALLVIILHSLALKSHRT